MPRLKPVNNYMLFFFFIFFAATSCKNEDSKKKADEQTVADASKGSSPKAAFTGGTLDTLWMESKDFPNNPEKIVFSFIIDANDKLTIHGWKDKGGAIQFDPDPNYKLNNGRPGLLTFGPNTYFGNVVLAQSDAAKIRNKINQGNYLYVVFAPFLLNNKNIGYKVFVSKDNPTMMGKVLVVDPADADLNPSPPKNY